MARTVVFSGLRIEQDSPVVTTARNSYSKNANRRAPANLNCIRVLVYSTTAEAAIIVCKKVKIVVDFIDNQAFPAILVRCCAASATPTAILTTLKIVSAIPTTGGVVHARILSAGGRIRKASLIDGGRARCHITCVKSANTDNNLDISSGSEFDENYIATTATVFVDRATDGSAAANETN